MIRRRVLLLAVTTMLVATSAVFAQNTGIPKIPRRVYFAPLSSTPTLADRSYLMVPDYLYTAISARRPIVRVADPSQAQSLVRVSTDPSGHGLTVRLLEGGQTVESASFPGGGKSALASFIESTAEAFAPHLGFVEPRIERIGTAPTSAASRELIDRVRRADRLASPIELSLSAAGLIRSLTGGNQGNAAIAIDAMPAIADFVWYPGRSLGLVGSVWGYYGTGMTFGSTESSGAPGRTRSFFILPGIGFKYRSLGDLFASFSGVVYGGYAHVTNITSSRIGSYNTGSFKLFLYPGASTSIFYMTVRFTSSVGYAITPHILAQAGVALDLSPALFYSASYPSDGNGAFIQYLSVGLVYRP